MTRRALVLALLAALLVAPGHARPWAGRDHALGALSGLAGGALGAVGGALAGGLVGVVVAIATGKRKPRRPVDSPEHRRALAAAGLPPPKPEPEPEPGPERDRARGDTGHANAALAIVAGGVAVGGFLGAVAGVPTGVYTYGERGAHGGSWLMSAGGTVVGGAAGAGLGLLVYDLTGRGELIGVGVVGGALAGAVTGYALTTRDGALGEVMIPLGVGTF